MKLRVFGFITLLFAVGLGSGGNGQGENAVATSKEELQAAIDVTAFAAEVSIVEQELVKATGVSRGDALAMLGRSSAASGRFDVAASAYAMFLNEFGTDHPYSERIAVRLADCLFPFKYDQIDVVHSASGPRVEPAWRMDYSPRPEHLRQAVHAFELAASLAQDQPGSASALLKLGWVHRVLGDWDTSTAVWDRCAKEAAPTKSAADALWLAAENLEWTNQPAAATERLTRLTREFPQDDRISAATERVEYLQAEARRSPDWLADPVASLKSEIEARTNDRTPQEVHRSFVQGLQRRGKQDALIAVNRWACDQRDWPVQDRVRACFDFADTLVDAADQGSREEAVQRLREIVEVTPDDEAAVHAALRCCRILNQLERYDETERMMETIVGRVKGSRRWEPVVLTQYAESLLQRGEKGEATRVLDRLIAAYPDYGVSESLEALQKANRAEGGR